jgi:hypothetical protein
MLLIILFMGIFQSDSRTETQKYETIKTQGDFEIRFYPPALLASVDMGGSYDETRNGSFRTLAGYIFGGNEEDMQISMTSPVRMSESEGTMSFVMPSKFTRESLPNPKTQKIRIHESEPAYVAVVRFGGWASDDKIAAMKQKLAAWLKEQGVGHTGKFEYLGYNPPFQIANRRNEVLVELDKPFEK